ncbi:hypothetical protein H2199_000746 [Coniosporium tulheliwenetii]|uniref:Uncharacterized protein n=1 Tax=Coniosporium tulheliwenetii TaxID=3383036 RepID=A0ACC2ZMP3_9PEZI|nr:hypothetical protein H2199_000746 [Cladosporium sp. JES 115]
MSIIYRERERERDWDMESTRSGPRTFTTVRRYKVPERSFEEDRREEEVRIVRRERDTRDSREYAVERGPPPRDVREYRYVEREVERAPSPPRRDVREFRYEREVELEPQPQEEVREYRIRREVLPPAPEPIREYRVEREIELEPPENPYQLEKYSKSTEYYARAPEPPNHLNLSSSARRPLNLHEQPSYEIIERTEVPEERQIARREPQPRQEEDYYYERRCTFGENVQMVATKVPIPSDTLLRERWLDWEPPHWSDITERGKEKSLVPLRNRLSATALLEQ